MRTRMLTALLGLSLTQCGGADPQSGAGARLTVAKAQYVARAISTVAQDEVPEIHSVLTLNNDIFPGISGKSVTGTVGKGASAVWIGLQGDRGHWILPVQDPDPFAPGDITFSGTISFAKEIEPGAHQLLLRAASPEGNVGPVSAVPLTVQADQPEGALVIRLEWDSQADLDLHVEAPHASGGTEEIWSRKPSGLAPGGSASPTVEEGMLAGYLDRDANKQCQWDGRQSEHVVIPESANRGHYRVRVATYSLCGQTSAHWRIRVFRRGEAEAVLGALGQSTAIDTRFPHGIGAGILALEFDY